jgi:hypothetical protein
MLQAMYRKYVGAKVRDIQFEYFRTLQNQWNPAYTIIQAAC